MGPSLVPGALDNAIETENLVGVNELILNKCLPLRFNNVPIKKNKTCVQEIVLFNSVVVNDLQQEILHLKRFKNYSSQPN